MERPKPVAWQPDRLLRVLLTWTSLTTLVFWLPTVRCAFDGRSYEWGLGRMRGAGLSGDYWFPVLGAALACWLVTRGWRGARPPFRWVFPAWHAALAVVITERAIALGDRLTWEGGTLGVIIPLQRVGPLLFGTVACAAIYWARRDLRSPAQRFVAPHDPIDRSLAKVLLALLPVTFFLLRFGEPSGLTDLGVCAAGDLRREMRRPSTASHVPGRSSPAGSRSPRAVHGPARGRDPRRFFAVANAASYDRHQHVRA